MILGVILRLAVRAGGGGVCVRDGRRLLPCPSARNKFHTRPGPAQQGFIELIHEMVIVIFSMRSTRAVEWECPRRR